MAPNESQVDLRWVELFDPQKYYPVLEVLSSYLTIADFLVLCQVCKRLGGLKDYMLRRISNIDGLLKEFMNDPVMFRSQLGIHGAIISGSFALNVFELGNRRVQNLDIFIKDGINADQFTAYIRESEKYKHEKREVGTTQQRSVYRNSARPDIELRITRGNRPPIQDVLTSTCTTAHFNVITWNKAYSIFPRQTLIDHQFYPLTALNDDFGSELNDLASQGWTSRDIRWPDFADVKVCEIEGLRRIGDRSTLVIPLNTDFVQASPIPDSVIEHTQFDVSGNETQHNYHWNQPPPNLLRPNPPTNASSRKSFLKIRWKELASPALHHGYTTASTAWQGYVTARLQRWVWLELFKIEPGTRPIQSVPTFRLISNPTIPESFEVPKSWDYADDQIPKWYREWEQA